MRIDLNCDLGEGAGHDAELMPLITSANIACGAHAGDEETIHATVALALRHNVAIGAHPGFADRANFGRRTLALAAPAIRELVLDQIAALKRICASHGAILRHVKPHGALYNAASVDEAVAGAIADAVASFDPGLILVGLANGCLLVAGAARGLRTAAEAFADRTYQPGGTLTPRTQPGALISEEATAARQAVQIVCEGRITAADGSSLPLRADTLCLHGDGPNAVALARRIRTALRAAGVALSAL